MLISSVNADNYKCGNFEPIVDDPTFIYLDYFNLKFMLPKLPSPRMYFHISYPIYGKLILIRQSRCWIRIHSSNAKELIIIYFAKYQPMITCYIINSSTYSYLLVPSLRQQKGIPFVKKLCPNIYE